MCYSRGGQQVIPFVSLKPPLCHPNPTCVLEPACRVRLRPRRPSTSTSTSIKKLTLPVSVTPTN